MTENSQIIGVMVFAILIIIDAMFYGFGAAIQTINKNTVDKKAQENNDRRSILLSKMIEIPTNLINTIQIVVNLISVAIGLFQFKLFHHRLLNLIVVLYLLLTFGILVPKKLGHKYCDKWAYYLVDIINLLVILLKPVTLIITIGTDLICKVFGIDSKETFDDATEEIISMINEVHEQGGLLDSEAQMINNIFEFGDKDARDIMIHRKNVVAVSGDLTVLEAMKFMLGENYSRFPVFEDNLDNIIGLINLKDIFIAYNDNSKYRNSPINSIKGLIRKTVFIPETRSINILFKLMQLQKIHMVIVMDEYGQTSGLISMEDILEEIVGNILDEYDNEDIMIVKQIDGSYVIDGMTSLEEIEEVLEIKFNTQDCEILNGFLVSLLDKIPTANEILTVEYENYIFEVIKVEEKMIKSVKVSKKIEEEIQS